MNYRNQKLNTDFWQILHIADPVIQKEVSIPEIQEELQQLAGILTKSEEQETIRRAA